MFRCTECTHMVATPQGYTTRYRGGTRSETPIDTARCRRCGTVYWTDAPGPRKMHAALRTVPVDAGGEVGVWMPTETRPVVAGWYDTRFRHLEPQVLRLWWDGCRFVSEDRTVLCDQFLSWRGSWV